MARQTPDVDRFFFGMSLDTPVYLGNAKLGLNLRPSMFVEVSNLGA
jgi:hypothetical protein